MGRSTLREPKPSQAQVRASRRDLAHKVRDDWTYLNPCIIPPEHTTPGTEKRSIPLSQVLAQSSSIGRFSFPSSSDSDVTPHHPHDDGYQHDPYTIDENRVVSWKEPYYASSDPSSDEEPDNDALNITNARVKELNTHHPHSGGIGNRLKRHSLRLMGLNFDNGYEREMESEDGTPPDDPLAEPSAADQTDQALELQRRKQERKLRRRQRFELEMSWNDGLKFWQSRREAWCCAKTACLKDWQEFPVEGDSSDEQSEEEARDDLVASEECKRLPGPSSPSTATYLDSRSSSQSSALSLRRHKAHKEDHLRPPSPTPRGRRRTPRAQSLLLPVAAPLLPTSDPTRASMSPALYPSIYSKVVVQSLTPAVPINLTHLLPALVNGWKADGEWPASPPATPASNVSALAPTNARKARAAHKSKQAADKATGTATKRSSVSRPLSWVLPASANVVPTSTRPEPPSDTLKIPGDDNPLSPSLKRASAPVPINLPSSSNPAKPSHSPHSSADTGATPRTRSSTDTAQRRHSRASRPLSWLVETLAPSDTPRSSSAKHSSHSSSIDSGKPLPPPPVPAPPATYSPIDGGLDDYAPRPTPASPRTETPPTNSGASHLVFAPDANPPRGRTLRGAHQPRQRPLSAIISRERTDTDTASVMTDGLKLTRQDRVPSMKTGKGERVVEEPVRPRTGLRSVGGRIRKRLSAGEWGLASVA